MATLGKIRNHGVALIVIVGLAMLAFIVGDFLSSSNTYFNRRKEYVGEIEGQKIHYLDYEAKKDQLQEVYKIEFGRNDFDEDMMANIRNSAWSLMVADYTFQAQAEEIGMTVTDEELADLCFGQNIHKLIRERRPFYGQDGQFSAANLIQFLANLENEPENAEQQAYHDQAKKYWMYWENAVRITRLQEKYQGLLSKLITANSLDAEFAFNAAQTSTNVQYVMKPYFSIADDDVTVKNSDVKALYNQKKEQYKQEPNRAIAYVSFPVVPAEADFQAAEELLKRLQNEFYTTDDVMTVVNENSDITYNGANLSEDMVPEDYKEFCFGAGARTGNVTEITFKDNTYAMARLVEAGYSLPDSVQLKAIAKVEGQEDQELGWFTEAEMGKDLAAKAFAAKKGEHITMMQGMQEAEFEVMDISKPTPKVKLAILARVVTASSKTYAAIFNEAKQFIVANPTEAKFQEAATEAGMVVRPALNLLATTDKVADLKSSRAIVRWAFEAKEGAVSDVFECGDQFIVAALTEVNNGDYRPFEKVAAELRFEALNNKKAEKVAADLKGVASLEDAAHILDVDILTAEGVTLAGRTFGAAGVEPAVIGAALRLAPGELSAPIKGIAGVYVVKGGDKATAEGEFNKEVQTMMLNYQLSNHIYRAESLLQEKADITDHRANFQ